MNIDNLISFIKEQKVDGVMVSSVANITYLTGYGNFSKEERDCYLLVSEKEQLLVTHSLLAGELRVLDHGFEVVELTARSKFKNIFNKFIKKNRIKKLGIEEEDLRLSEFKRFSGYFRNLVGINLEELRILKEEDEVEKIKKACEIGDRAFEYVLKKMSKALFQKKVGISEKEIVWELEKFVKEKGFEFSFRAIVCFGKNSAIPHHLSDETKLEKNQFVLMDFGVKYQNYCSDMTRTFIFGDINSEEKKIYNTVKGAQEKAEEYIKNNLKKKIKMSAIDKTARDYIISKGYPTIPHSLGHGIGIEVHERPHVSPRSSEVLERGMVFSIEPGIYLEGFGGVRIEDLYYFNGSDLIKLTNSKNSLIELK